MSNWNVYLTLPIEVPLVCHDSYPSLIFKAKIDAIDNIQEVIAGISSQFIRRNQETSQRMFSDGPAAYDDFESQGNLQDLNQAILRYETIAERLPRNSPTAAPVLSNLGLSLMRRFEQLGEVEDMNRGIEQLEIAVRLTPDGDSDKPSRLNDLGTSLNTRFKWLGNIKDIDGAIARHQAAVHLAPSGHSDKPSLLTNLGTSLLARFERLGSIDDINGAIAQQQEAIHLTLDRHPDQLVCLTNLGMCLLRRFERLGNTEDINSAVAKQQEAVRLTPDGHPNKPKYLNNLGFALSARFKRLGNMGDIDSAITHQQAVVHLTPDRHPDKPIRLTNLGNSFLGRFRRLGNINDINSAIAQHQAAVRFTPDGHFNNPAYLANLGMSYGLRFIHFRHPQDAEVAISHLSASTKSSVGAPAARFEAARKWLSLASVIGHRSSLTACECAIELIPLVAWLGLPIKDRHEYLTKIGEVARDAATTAILFERYDKALEWLEQGRSIVWNQILQLRTPVDELRIVNSALAERLVSVSRLLDGGFEQEGSFGSAEQSGQRYRVLTREWESIIEQVRSLPNFEDFLKPSKVSRLMDAARNGPVVILNITQRQCDALALISGIEEVMHIPLPEISFRRVMELQDELKNYLYSNGLRLRGDRAAQRWADRDESNDCKDILAELWKGVVKPVLDYFAFPVRLIQFFVCNSLTSLP
jgi:tetratricopeptide (TPR) repeat protein